MFIDIHSHIIWGVDDGAQSREQTFAMLRAAATDGIGKIICTPHNTPGVLPFPEERFQEHLQIAREYVRSEGLPIHLTRGAEIFYTEMTPRFLREGKVATLEGSRYALVEFSPTESWEKIRESLHNISIAGFTPVLAHIERYGAIHKTAQVHELKEFCYAKIQVNARTLLRKQPLMRRGYFDSIFREELVDFIATDTHAMPGRETCLREGLEALREKYGEACLQRIIRETEALFGGIEPKTVSQAPLREEVPQARQNETFRRRSSRYLVENS